MNFDFSQTNLQYLIQARELAQHDPELAATLLGMPNDLAQLLATLSPQDVARVALIKVPLIIPRQETWWWSRLFTALRDGRAEEIDVIVEQPTMLIVSERSNE